MMSKRPAEGSPAEEATESPAFEKREDATPAVPGNDSSTKGFEGFANKEAPTGKALFHAKHSARPAGSPPRGTAPVTTKRTPSTTKRSFIKKIGD